MLLWQSPAVTGEANTAICLSMMCEVVDLNEFEIVSVCA